MGMYVSLYVGPYMVVTGTKDVVTERSVRTCSNNECETYKANKKHSETQKFCAECGSIVEIKKYSEIEKDYPNWMLSDVEDFEDELCETTRDSRKDDKQVFVPNEKIPFQPERHTDGEHFNMNLLDMSQTEEVEWFKKRYEKIISFFKDELGENSVEFRWGVVQWYS